MADLFISFLNQFCQKNKIEPIFEVKSTGPRHCQIFFCEVRLPGYSYVGEGNATNKKDARSNSARDFINFLFKEGHVKTRDVPIDLDFGPVTAKTGNSRLEDLSTTSDPLQQDIVVEEAEDVDANAEIHGNWTLRNAKSKLHQFMQSNDISADYKYTSIGASHIKYFFAEMNIFVSQLGRTIYGFGTGSSKQAASKCCALSLVRQLYHLGVIEAFLGSLKEKQTDPETVLINPVQQVQEGLKNLSIEK